MFCSSPHDFLVTTQLTEPLEHFKTSRFLSVRAEQQEVAICWCIPVNINQCLNRHLYIIHGPDATFHQQSIDNLPVSRFRVLHFFRIDSRSQKEQHSALVLTARNQHTRVWAERVVVLRRFAGRSTPPGSSSAPGSASAAIPPYSTRNWIWSFIKCF